MNTLRQEQILPLTLREAWDFFSTPRNLEKITPDGMKFQITSLESETMHEGQLIQYRIRLAPCIWTPWLTEITEVQEPVRFVDRQLVGPYHLWHHTHEFEELEDGKIRMTDVVRYHVGWGPVGWLAEKLYVDRTVRAIFEHRRNVLQSLFEDA